MLHGNPLSAQKLVKEFQVYWELKNTQKLGPKQGPLPPEESPDAQTGKAYVFQNIWVLQQHISYYCEHGLWADCAGQRIVSPSPPLWSALVQLAILTAKEWNCTSYISLPFGSCLKALYYLWSSALQPSLSAPFAIARHELLTRSFISKPSCVVGTASAHNGCQSCQLSPGNLAVLASKCVVCVFSVSFMVQRVVQNVPFLFFTRNRQRFFVP